LQAPSHTCCENAKAATTSAIGFALCKYNHIHPVGRQRQQHHQQRDLHFSSTTTYRLWKCGGSKSISKGICILQAPSHTNCGKAKATTASARRSALCKHHHIQSVGRQRQQQHQQGGLHFTSTITYFLWEGKSSNSISKGVCTLQVQSHTTCGKAKATMASARSSALCKHHHIQSVGRQRQQPHQQGGLHFVNTITYTLLEGKGSNHISKKVHTL
jgi:hypothetical protein